MIVINIHFWIHMYACTKYWMVRNLPRSPQVAGPAVYDPVRSKGGITPAGWPPILFIIISFLDAISSVSQNFATELFCNITLGWLKIVQGKIRVCFLEYLFYMTCFNFKCLPCLSASNMHTFTLIKSSKPSTSLQVKHKLWVSMFPFSPWLSDQDNPQGIISASGVRLLRLIRGHSSKT